LDQIKKEIPQSQIELMTLDLANLTSVRKFTQAFKSRYDRLDILVNNAGIMWIEYGKTVDGFERQFGTNHLGHFALTGQLMDLILKTPNARIVNVSSVGHRSGTMDFENLMFEGGKEYGRHRAYGRSKLANLLFTYELQRKFETRGVDAIATAAHPGGSSTNLARNVEHLWYFRLLTPLLERMMQGADMGALPTLRAAVDPAASGSEYYGPGGFMEQTGFPVIVQSSEASHNAADARQLWEVSEELTGIHYNWN
jgi:NAD(P)-dependent dehydrogenase (short-subunit alcohol dehydrogenase family)